MRNVQTAFRRLEEMKQKPKLKKVLLIAVPVVLVAIIGVLVYYFLTANIIYKEKSPDGKYTIIVKELEAPMFFGPQELEIKVTSKNPRKEFVGTTFYSDDGGSVYPENIKITWESDGVSFEMPASERGVFGKIYYTQLK
jgi:hypothetical protein